MTEIGNQNKDVGSEDEPRFYHCGEADYIFLRKNGVDRAVCEVRGVGEGKYEENRDFLLEALNDHLKMCQELRDVRAMASEITAHARTLIQDLSAHTPGSPGSTCPLCAEDVRILKSSVGRYREYEKA
jgi:hypothetical protein